MPGALPPPSIIQTHSVAQLRTEALRPIRLLRSSLAPSPRVSAALFLGALCFISIKEQLRTGLVKTLASAPAGGFPVPPGNNSLCGVAGRLAKETNEHWDKHLSGATSKLCWPKGGLPGCDPFPLTVCIERIRCCCWLVYLLRQSY